MIVAVNDDESVARLKGASRPVFPLAERLEVLTAIFDIDFLLSFSEETPRKLIKTLLPDILVKGGDYDAEDIVGYEEVTSRGGSVEIIPLLEGYSSTSIIQKSKQ